MNKIIKNIGLLALSSLLFTGCNDDDATGDSLINFSTVQVTLTSDMNNIVIDESAIDVDNPTVITVTATIAEPSPISLRIPLEWKSGSANASDYATATIVIPAYTATSASTTVIIEKTGDIEGNETLVLGAGESPNLTTNNFELAIDIQNDYINDVLSMEVDWAGEGSYTASLPAEITVDFCDMDLDLLVYDSTFADTGIYDAATGSCPESVDFSALADGTYYLVVNVYDNPFSALGASLAVPVTVTYSQEYIIDETSFVNGIGVTTDTPAGSNILIAELEVVNGYVYTVTPQ